MNHWKSANFGSDKHLPQLSPPQSSAYGGRAGIDGKWWKIVCMCGAHVRFDPKSGHWISASIAWVARVMQLLKSRKSA